MIQTSYFSSKAPHGRKVCIAKWPPRYWQGLRAPLFAPSNPKAPDWEAAYRQDLLSRFPTGRALRVYLEQILHEMPDPILCCFETDPGRCHRRILAEYIKEKLGWEVEEWSGDGPKQAVLF